MIPLPWPLVSRRPVEPARSRDLPLSVDPDAARRLPFVRYDGTARPDADGWDRLVDAVARYRFFPPARLRGWVDAADGRVAPGVTIVQRVRVVVVGFESATRVTAVEDSADADGRRTFGFDYVTLVGHPERGLARFRVTEDGSGGIACSIETWSAPDAWWARLGAPVTGLLQRRTNRAVIARLVAIAEGRDRALLEDGERASGT
ncbi:MAG: DUF1990 family protein [Chloroflexota bacterium]